jgi:hypothetical protein
MVRSSTYDWGRERCMTDLLHATPCQRFQRSSYVFQSPFALRGERNTVDLEFSS